MTRIAGLAVEPPPAPLLSPRTTSTAFDGAFFAPRSLDELLALRAAHPEALLLAGGTDLGLLASRERRPPKAVIHLAHVPELAAISAAAEKITIGAAATYEAAAPTLIAAFPALRSYLSRLGSRQIRNMGTIGGNIGTASPIGDMPPVLLALEASLTLVSQRGAREILLDDFFLDYRKTALAPDEIIQSPVDAAPVGGRDLSLRQGEQAPRPGHLDRRRRLSRAHPQWQDRGCAAGLRRHGRDTAPGAGGRGGLIERRVCGGDRRGGERLQAARRLARFGRLSPAVAANLLRRLELRLAEPGRVLEVEAL